MMLGSWSGMRKYLEQDMLAERLRGRVRWNCTKYANMDGAGVFEVYVDDALWKRFSMETVACAACGPRAADGSRDMKLFWEAYWAQKELPPDARSEFDDEDLALALTEYRALPVQASIESDDPVVRMFAVLDRRIGRRTLEKLRAETAGQPAWLQPFYRLRMEAEGI